jgi:ketosteroid isomerase-like protein
VSAENVELVRRLQPDSEVDLAVLFRDDHAFAVAENRLAPFFHPDCEVLGGPDTVSPTERTGLSGLRQVWLEWLKPWASYRSEIKQLIDLGDRVVVLIRDSGRFETGGPAVELTSAAIWTVRDEKIARVVFYTSRESALGAAGLD